MVAMIASSGWTQRTRLHGLCASRKGLGGETVNRLATEVAARCARHLQAVRVAKND